MNIEEVFLIWSNEHSAWWSPREQGYTGNVADAGHYTQKRAIEICNSALHGSRPPIMNEIPVRLIDVMDTLTFDNRFAYAGKF